MTSVVELVEDVLCFTRTVSGIFTLLVLVERTLTLAVPAENVIVIASPVWICCVITAPQICPWSPEACVTSVSNVYVFPRGSVMLVAPPFSAEMRTAWRHPTATMETNGAETHGDVTVPVIPSSRRTPKYCAVGSASTKTIAMSDGTRVVTGVQIGRAHV